MAGIQVLRIESRVTLDTSLARHIDGGSRPETARDVAVPVVELGGVGVEAGGAAIEAARPRGRGRPPHHAVELVLGGPPPYGSDEWPEEREREWAEACYEWAQGVLGSRSVIVSAAWHRDETSPHIHVLAVPIDSSEKLRWKGVRDEAADRLGVPRRGRKLAAAYRAFQDDFYESVSAGYGLGRGEVGSSARHVQIDRAVAAERRREVAEAGADEADARAADARKVMARREKLYEEAAEFDRRRVSASAAAVQKEAEHDELKRQVDRLCSVLAAAEARGGWMRRARAERELQAREAAADGREEAVTKREVMVDGREPDVEAREAAVADLAQRKSEADKARSAAHTAEGRSLSMARLARHRRQRVLDAIQDARDERELLAAAQAAAETVEANLEVRGRDLDTRAGELDERETGIEARAGARADELAVVRTRERSDGLDRRESGIEARAGARADELAVVRTRERSDGLDRREAGIEARAGARADELAVVCTRERSDGLDRREAGIEARGGRQGGRAGRGAHAGAE